jgi:hypothetical protein
MPELLAGWENPSQRLVPASRSGRLGFIEGVGFMCYAVRRGEAGAHTWRIHCLARSSVRLPAVGFLADGEYSCGSVSGLRGTQSPMHGLKAGILRLIGLRRLTHRASLVATALLLCLAPLLFWSATRAEVPGTFGKADWSRMGQWSNGNELPFDGSYLAVSGEEIQDSGKGPVNAGLLSALLLAFCFDAMIGWLLANGWGQETFRSSAITGSPSFVTTRRDRQHLTAVRSVLCDAC